MDKDVGMALVPAPDDPPEALRTLYADLPDAVVAVVEAERRAIIHDMLEHLRRIRDALAPSGTFKAWCQAAGVNYGTVKNRLSLADRKLADNATLPARQLPTGPAKYDHGWSMLTMYRRYAAKFPRHLPPAPPGDREEDDDWAALWLIDEPYTLR